MTKLAAAIAVLGLATTGVAVAATPAHTKKLSADPGGGLTFTKHRITVRHGVVKLVMKNPRGSGLPHGIAIAGHGKGKIVNPGGSSTVKAKLKRGTYTFYCPFPGHKAAGMKGTLMVD
jgi:plastocyanin